MNTMLRTIVISVLFSFHLVAIAQEQKLYLFITADSLKQGVKDQDGHFVIPADHPTVGYWSDGELITESILDFYGMPVHQSFDFDSLYGSFLQTSLDLRAELQMEHFFSKNRFLANLPEAKLEIELFRLRVIPIDKKS